MLIKISHIYGVKLYINGEIKYKNSELTELTDVRLLLPVTLFDNTTLFAIELDHKKEENTQFSIIAMPVKGDSEEGCLILNDYINPFEKYSGEENPIKGFDNIKTTYWSYSNNNKEVWAELSFKDNILPYINMYKITNCGDDNYPEKIVLSDIFESSIEYDETNSQMFFIDNKDILEFNVSYTEFNNENKFCIVDNVFSLCNIRICPEVQSVELNSDEAGTIFEKNCTNGESKKKFKCPYSHSPKWIEIENNCEDDEPILMYKTDSITFNPGEKYTDISLASFSGNSLKYSIEPTIEGLTINEDTGLISGIPISKLSELKHTIKATNKNGNAEAEILITINEPTIPILVSYTAKVEVKAGKVFENEELYTVLNADTVTYTGLPNYIKIEDGKINGLIYDVGTFNVKFEAKNTHGVKEFVIVFDVTSPDETKVVMSSELNLVYGETYQLLYPIRCVGKNLKYEVGDSMIPDLQYNSETGELSGKVTIEKIEPIEYRFYCTGDVGNDEKYITLSVSYSDYPLVINTTELTTIVAGEDYDDFRVCYVTGNNLLFSVNPDLPKSLVLNSTTGGISGYITESTPLRTYIMIVTQQEETNNLKSALVTVEFKLEGKVDNTPSYVKSSLVESYTIVVGKYYSELVLFKPVGNDIYISVSPPLPAGFYLHTRSGFIYGTTVIPTEEQLYTFSITNKYGLTRVRTYLKTAELTCPADSGFPESIATAVGNTVYVKCSSMETGLKTRKCYLNDDDTARWGDIEDTCHVGGGTKAAIIVGVLLLVAIIGFCVFFLVVRRGAIKKLIDSHRTSTDQPPSPIRRRNPLKPVAIIDDHVDISAV